MGAELPAPAPLPVCQRIVDEGVEALDRGDADEAVRLGAEVEKAAATLGDPAGLAISHLLSGSALMRKHRIESAVLHFRSAETAARRMVYVPLVIEALLSQAAALTRVTPSASQRLVRAAVRLADGETESPLAAARGLSDKAHILGSAADEVLQAAARLQRGSPVDLARTLQRRAALTSGGARRELLTEALVTAETAGNCAAIASIHRDILALDAEDSPENEHVIAAAIRDERDRCLAARTDPSGRDGEEYVRLLVEAEVAIDTRDLAAAEQYLILAEKLSARSVTAADAVTALRGVLEVSLGRPDKAIPLLRDSTRYSGPGFRRLLTRARVAMIEALLATNRSAEAAAALDAAQRVDDKSAGVVEHATWDRLAGDLARHGGALAQAAVRYESSFRRLEDAGLRGHPEAARALAGFARVVAAEGRLLKAVSYAQDAASRSSARLRALLPAVSESAALMQQTTEDDAIGTLISLAQESGSPDHVAVAWHAVISVRALVLDEVSHRAKEAHRLGDPESSRLKRMLAQLNEDLEQLTVDSAATRPEVAALTASRRAVETTLLARMWRTRSALKELPSFSALTAALGDNLALLAYVRFARVAANRPAAKSTPYYAAFLLTRSADPTIRILGPATEIDAAVSNWRRSLLDEATADVPGTVAAERSYRRIAQQLAKLIWVSPGTVSRGLETLLIVPDGALNTVSFSALTDERGRYISENPWAVHYVSAERDIIHDHKPGVQGGLLVVGAPAYDNRKQIAEPRRPSNRGPTEDCLWDLHFEPLPETRKEVDEIAALYAAEQGAVRMLTGPDATEDSVTRFAPNAEVLHFATHGFFLERDCRDQHRASPEGPYSYPRNPLFLAGLALAGANTRITESAGGSGILFAEEIAGLDLSRVKWAVLSGCDTGLGPVQSGEGVLGLRRAFAQAGTASVVMSLWPVEDRSARMWMTELYRARFRGRLSTAEAVRTASLKRLHARRAFGQSTHPFYWAAFVSVGDWH